MVRVSSATGARSFGPSCPQVPPSWPWFSDDADCLFAALDRLPTLIREAVVTAYYGQLTYREAADALGVPEGTIKSRIRLGLRQLRTELAKSQTSFA